MGTSFLYYYDKAFVNCKSLKSLHINLSESMPETKLNAIRNSLKSNKGLKKLNITCNSLFDEDFSSEINFNLTEFDAFLLHIHGLHSVQNFKKFLATQKDSLETLHFYGWEAIVHTMATILSMPRLKKLRLGGLEDLRNPIQLATGISQQNCSITTLDLSFLNLRNSNTLKIVLGAFPKVQNLIICRFSDIIAVVISEQFKSLKNLSVSYFEVTNMIGNEEFYRNLENFFCYENVRSTSKRLFNELGVKSKSRFDEFNCLH